MTILLVLYLEACIVINVVCLGAYACHMSVCLLLQYLQEGGMAVPVDSNNF